MGGLQGSDDQKPGDRTVMEDGTAVHQTSGSQSWSYKINGLDNDPLI